MEGVSKKRRVGGKEGFLFLFLLSLFCNQISFNQQTINYIKKGNRKITGGVYPMIQTC